MDSERPAAGHSTVGRGVRLRSTRRCAMPIFPNADFRPVTRFKPGGSLHIESHGQRRVVLHTAVSDKSSLFSSMNVPGTETSHFYIDRHGKVEQYVDTAIRS